MQCAQCEACLGDVWHYFLQETRKNSDSLTIVAYLDCSLVQKYCRQVVILLAVPLTHQLRAARQTRRQTGKRTSDWVLFDEPTLRLGCTTIIGPCGPWQGLAATHLQVLRSALESKHFCGWWNLKSWHDYVHPHKHPRPEIVQPNKTISRQGQRPCTHLPIWRWAHFVALVSAAHAHLHKLNNLIGDCQARGYEPLHLSLPLWLPCSINGHLGMPKGHAVD